MDIPSQVLAQFVIILSVILITASYLYSLSLYTSFLKQRELEVTAYKITHQTMEAINEAIKSKSNIIKNALIGSIFKGRIINEKDHAVLELSDGNLITKINLPVTIGLKESKNKISIQYKDATFITYNVTIVVQYKEEGIVVVQLG